jgi:glutathione reductase (NADPH)
MARYDFDLFTIGAGSGGVAASRRAGSYGARVALAEVQEVGGTCVHRGCIPKKLLVYGSHYREEFHDAAGYGWSVREPTFDWAKLQAAKKAELHRLEGVYGRLLRDANVTLVKGRARVVDPHTVEVAGQRYTAEHLLVAVGGRPSLPETPGIEHAITSDEALSLPELPRRLVVVGGGYIGVELACVFSGLGTEVTLLLRGAAVLRGFDVDVRAFVTEELRKRGITVLADTTVRDIEKRPEGGVSVLTNARDMLEADHILYATGRVPKTAGLGLTEAGVQLTPRGAVVVDAYSRSSVPSIWAVGDVTDRINLTPVAVAEGRALAETLFRNTPTCVDHGNVASAVFSQPPVGCVGLTEAEARAKEGEVDVYVSSFRPLKHTVSGRNERAMMKLVVARASGRVLGFHMVGTDAPEILQGMAVALRCGVTKAQLDATIGIHPTASEEFVTMRERRGDNVERLAEERGQGTGSSGSH